MNEIPIVKMKTYSDGQTIFSLKLSESKTYYFGLTKSDDDSLPPRLALTVKNRRSCENEKLVEEVEEVDVFLGLKGLYAEKLLVHRPGMKRVFYVSRIHT